MLKFRSNFNGRPSFSIIHGFRHLLLYSTSTSSSTSISAETNPNFVNYLVEFLGFPRQQALSTSVKLSRIRLIRGAKKVGDFDFIENADSVVNFFKQNGLEHYHIRNAVVSVPEILLSNVNKTLIPKIQAIQKLGISGSDFAEVVKVNPSILLIGLNTQIVPAIQALREVMGLNYNVIAILKKSRGRWFSCIPRNLVPNVALLQKYGIPIESIQKYLLRLPSALFRKTELFEDTLIKVEEELGIPRNSPQFLLGIHLLASHNEKTIHSKKEMFKSFGWTESDVIALLRKNPPCFSLSAATIKKKLGFLMNELGYQPNFILSRSCLLTYSLEKRIMLRHKVLLVLKEKSLIRTDYSVLSVVSLTESQFLNKFVLPFKEVHQVYSKLAGLSLDMLTLGSPKPNSDAAS